jgi:hypothetical protein
LSSRAPRAALAIFAAGSRWEPTHVVLNGIANEHRVRVFAIFAVLRDGHVGHGLLNQGADNGLDRIPVNRRGIFASRAGVACLALGPALTTLAHSIKTINAIAAVAPGAGAALFKRSNPLKQLKHLSPP